MKDISGQRYGRLFVERFSHVDSNGGSHWICLCDCGITKVVRRACLINGKTKSCGCLKHELLVKKHLIHGGRHSRLYKILSNMIARCERETSNRYRWYGARGIRVCSEWRHDFGAFRDWALSHGYADNLTIDRIQSNKNYQPDNCQWLTRSANTEKERKEHATN